MLRDKIPGVVAKLDEFPFGNISQHIEEMPSCEMIVAGNTGMRAEILGGFSMWCKPSQNKVLSAAPSLELILLTISV